MHRTFVPALLLLAALVLLPAVLPRTACGEDAPAAPQVETRAVTYQDGDAVLEGFLAYDAARPGKRPGVLLVHEWWGLGEHPKERARALARAGYVAFALDMYGQGKLTDDPAQAGQWAGQFRGDGAAKGRARARLGLDVLCADEHVDPERVAAIGFCFGGTVALELAWSGAPLKAAVCFHGNPTTPALEEVPGVKASILVLHGADDPLVPDAALEAFRTALRAARLDWELDLYGGAVHSFTNPGADAHGIPGVKYDERTARRAWQRMLDLLAERLGS